MQDINGSYDECDRELYELIEKKGKCAKSDEEVVKGKLEIIGEAINKGVPLYKICDALKKLGGFHGSRAKLSKLLDEAGVRKIAVRKPVTG